MNNMNFRLGSVPIVFPTSEIFPVTSGLRAEVRFGMASRNCSGLGICSVEATARMFQLTGSCDRSIAYLTYEHFGQIRFHFFFFFVCLKAEKKHFRRGEFIVRETFGLPGKFIRRYDLNQGKIPSGRYPVEESEHFWRVTFNQINHSDRK